MKKSPNQSNGTKIDFSSATFNQLKGLSCERLRAGLQKLAGKSKKVRAQRDMVNRLLGGNKGESIFSVTNKVTQTITQIFREPENVKGFKLVHRSLCGDVVHDFPEEDYEGAIEAARWIGTSREAEL